MPRWQQSDWSSLREWCSQRTGLHQHRVVICPERNRENLPGSQPCGICADLPGKSVASVASSRQTSERRNGQRSAALPEPLGGRRLPMGQIPTPPRKPILGWRLANGPSQSKLWCQLATRSPDTARIVPERLAALLDELTHWKPESFWKPGTSSRTRIGLRAGTTIQTVHSGGVKAKSHAGECG